MDRYEETVNLVKKVAEKNFVNHVIVRKGFEGESSWYTCGYPGSNINRFNVGFFPRTIVFWGDLGDYILSLSSRDSFGWLPGAVNSPGYVFEKVRMGAGIVDCWYPGDMVDFIKNKGAPDFMEEDYPDLIKILREHNWVNFSQEEWNEVICDYDFEMCNWFLQPSFHSLMTLESMIWFCSNINRFDQKTIVTNKPSTSDYI